MGLPINKISVAVNNNDILHRFLVNNDYSKQLVHETISPSMDISVASNFERLVYDFFLDRDSAKCADMFDNFPANPIELDSEMWQKKDNLFSSSKVNDLDTKKMIQEIYQSNGYILDPHTAVAAVEALRKSDQAIIMLFYLLHTQQNSLKFMKN